MTEHPADSDVGHVVTNIKVVVDEGAFVASSASISCRTRDVYTEQMTVKVVIAEGTIFHPESNLVFWLPPSSIEYIIHVGSHNIFEERCHISITIDSVDTCEEWKAIGSYNTFHCKSRVEGFVTSIGDDNVLEAASCIHFTNSGSVGKGVVLTPALRYQPLDKHDNEVLTDVVLYQVPRGHIHRRPHSLSSDESQLAFYRAQQRAMTQTLLTFLTKYHAKLS